MNLIDAEVTEILSKPYCDDYRSGNFYWRLIVRYVCIGGVGKRTLMFKTKEEAQNIKIGYHFYI